MMLLRFLAVFLGYMSVIITLTRLDNTFQFKVCVTLLDELAAGIEQTQCQYKESKTPISDGYITLMASPSLVLGGKGFCKRN